MSGFENDVLVASNVNFNNSAPKPHTGIITTDGQLLIGSTASPKIRAGVLTSPDASVTIGYDAPNITLQASGSAPNPAAVVQLVDDFICGQEPGNLFGWNQSGNFHPFPGTANNPGICQFLGGTSGIYFGGTQQDNTSPADSILIGHGSLVLNFVIDIVALSDDTDTYAQYTGIFNTAPFINLTGFGPDSGVYFQYTNSVDSGNWQIVVNNNGTSTVQDSGVPATTGFHNYGISINADATSATFFIDGVQVGTPITTNFPVVPIAPGMVRVPSAGTDPSWLVDLFYMTLNLTTSR